MAHALPEMRRAGVQVDNRAARRDSAAILLCEHDAATGREHSLVERAQFRDYLALASAEPGFALDVENHRNAHAAAAFYFFVGVVERALQAAREHPSDGCLAGAHHADEDQAAFGFHDVILRRWKKKRPGGPGRSMILKSSVSGRSGDRSRPGE